jgi:PKD repeat protein
MNKWCWRLVKKCLYVVSIISLIAAYSVQAQILNPFYTEPDWKLWFDDSSSVYITPPNVANPVDHLSPIPLQDRLYPDDADTVLNPGRFLSFQDSNFPQRQYAGFWNDAYASLDRNSGSLTPHSYIRNTWSGDSGNFVRLRSPDSLMNIHLGYMTAALGSTHIRTLKDLGINWTSQSSTLMGHDLTNSFNDIDRLERNLYFANILRAGPAHISYRDSNLLYSDDLYDALVPVFYNSISSSGGETMALTKLATAGGYLDRAIKPELLRNGLYIPTMLYLWKNALPYDVGYEDELRHRVAYMSYGDGSSSDYGGGNRPDVATASYHYDPTSHLANMVSQAKGMKIVPPVALVNRIETLGGTELSVNKTTIRLQQAAGETAQIRVSVEESFDLQGLPLQFRWKVLNGNKDASVEYEGNATYLITVPDNPALPKGRTAISLVANNGFYDSNPAVVNIYRSTGAANNFRVRPVTGIEDRTILPGESVVFDLYSRDPEGFPIHYSKWEGVGELDGSRFTWNSATDTAEDSYPVHIIASDGTNGNGYNSGEAEITVSNTVAEISADVDSGVAPLAVNLAAAGSRDRDGNGLSYAWDFDDGNAATSANVSHTFTQPGFYQVALTVSGPLGSHTRHKIIEVKHAWPLTLNNGWDQTNGVDAGVWNATGASVVTNSSLGTRLSLSGGAIDVPVGITSVQSFTPPLYIETVFRRPTAGKTSETGVQILGSLLGNPKGIGGSYFLAKDMSIGHPSDTNPAVWDSQFVGAHVRFPKTISELRLYVEDDPNNPGRIRYRGYVEADLGRYLIRFDNQDPAESWFNNLLGVISEDAGAFELWRFQVWTPGGGASGPEIHVTGEQQQNVYNRLVGVNEQSKDSVIENDTTEFGYPDTAGGTVSKTYSIHNFGDTTLNLTGAAPYVTISGTHAGSFSVSSAPAASIPAGGSSQFSISFTPSMVGMHLATININSDDADESLLKFNVRGRDRAPQEINLQGNGVNIANIDLTPNLTDHTDFGVVKRSASLRRRFTVQNLGVEPLHLNSIDIVGPQLSDFTVVKAPEDILENGESTTLEIEFVPQGLGLRNATVIIGNDDTDEPGYTFSLQGQGVDSIDVDQGEVVISEGGFATFGVKLSAQPSSLVTVNVAVNSSAHLDGDISVQSGITLMFDASNWNSYQTVTLAAAEDDIDTFNGYALVTLTSSSSDFDTAYVMAMEADNDNSALPVAENQTLTVNQYCSVSTRLQGHDADEDGLTYSIAAMPSNGTLSVTLPDVTYTPNTSFAGNDSFTFIVNDGSTNSAPGLVSISVVSVDSDGDGLSDGQESCVYNTNPNLPDTDNDGLNDGDEVNVHGTDPLSNMDQDLDGMSDDWESAYGTSATSDDALGDLDGDGVNNVIEYLRGTLPQDATSTPVLKVIYVDAANTGGDGSLANPFGALSMAINAAQAGDTLSLASGLYDSLGSIMLFKPLKIVGPQDGSAEIVASYLSVYGLKWGGIYHLTLRTTYNNIAGTRNFVFDSSHLLPGEDYWLYQNSKVIFSNNLIENPGSATEALWIDNDSHAELVNNTIVGFPVGVRSEAYYFPTQGGAPGSALIRNSILQNSDDFVAPAGTMDVQYSFISDGEFAGSNGNLGGDPLFIDAAGGDYRLQAASPAMDSGDPVDAYHREPEANGCRINMGAYGNTALATRSEAAYDTDGLLGNCSSYTALNPKLANGSVQVISLADNTTIRAGTSSLQLDRYQTGSFPAGSLSQGTRIIGSGDFDISASISGTDMPVPSRLAGTRFVIPHYRYSHRYFLHSGQGDAHAQIRIGSNSYSLSLPQGQVVEFDAGANNSVSGLVTSDLPIQIAHVSDNGTGNYSDAYAVPPAATEIWGIRSNGAYLGALLDNTHISIHAENGSSVNVTLNAGDRYVISNGAAGTQGSGNGYHVIADQPIAGVQTADGDGVEQTAFLSTADLGVRFGIPTDAQYIAVVCPQANTTVSLYDNSGSLLDQQTCVGNGVAPGKAYFGSVSNGVQVSAGAYLESDMPVYVIYEDAATNDERNLLGTTMP